MDTEGMAVTTAVTCEAKTWCGTMRCWANDEAFVHELKRGRTFEQDLILGQLYPHLQHARILVDVGAHVGMHTVAYAHLRPTAHVFAFEPQERMFELLVHNVQANGLMDRVHLYHAAVGHRSGDAELAPVVQDGSHAGEPVEYGSERAFNLGGISLGQGGERVSMITLDELGLPGCDFLKMDVEGFEPLVVQGARNTIERFRPVILFEHNHKRITDAMRRYFDLPDTVQPVADFLVQRGYTITALPGDNFLGIPASSPPVPR